MIDRQHKRDVETWQYDAVGTRKSVRALIRGVNARRVRCTRSCGAGICNGGDGLRLRF